MSLLSEEFDINLAIASLEKIGAFVPDIDSATNIDLLPIAFNACVANRVNRNNDVIDTKTAIDIYKNFINKPINIEHNREKVIGTILKAGFSEFGTDHPLSEEEVSQMDGPFNITLGGVLWKVVNPRITKLVENSSRDVQIAFANELSLICEKAEINVWELINLANKHPRVNILQPGTGVGGHCIAVDPWFIVADFREEPVVPVTR